MANRERHTTRTGGGRKTRTMKKYPSRSFLETTFHEQATPEAIERMRQAAAHFAPYEAEDLVQQALCDTLDGLVAWVPERSLLDHVTDVVRFRARHERAHATRFRRVSLADEAERADADADDLDASAENPELIFADDDPASALVWKERRARHARVSDELARIAASDPMLHTFVTVYRTEDVTEWTDVLPPADYTNSRKRLRRLAAHVLDADTAHELRVAPPRLGNKRATPRRTIRTRVRRAS